MKYKLHMSIMVTLLFSLSASLFKSIWYEGGNELGVLFNAILLIINIYSLLTMLEDK